MAAEEVAVGCEPGDLCGNDGTTRQNGAHGGAADLSEVLPDGMEGTGLKTELDDGYDVVDVQVVHASFVAQLGLARVDVAQLHRVEEIDVHVVVVLHLVLLNEVGEAA